MKKVALVNIVGLSRRILHQLPILDKWSEEKNLSFIEPILPAVTCSSQTTYLTGKLPSEHGIVGNGWYFKDECEVKLWRQSNKLVQRPSIWDNARAINPAFTCANMFWWYNMYSSVDYSVTPRPQYRANGLKIPDCYTQPSSLRNILQKKLGTFPLFDFWGPKASIKSSRWIAAASKIVFETYHPNLTLVYLPHLDYCLQKYGHDLQRIRPELDAIDMVAGNLIQYFERKGLDVQVISEYGITNVNNPIHINRILREMGHIEVRVENGKELLDPGQSNVFALADHQIAHLYFNDKSKIIQVKQALEVIPGIAMVLDKEGKRNHDIDHERSGDLVLVSDSASWFTYYYWMDDNRAPDFARMVDIHKKPGYDPVEMFLDPDKNLIMPRVALKLIGKKLGLRTVMDVIPLRADLVRGSHGQPSVQDDDKALFIGNNGNEGALQATDIHDLLLKKIFPGNESAKLS